jgi:hypothetical protein
VVPSSLTIYRYDTVSREETSSLCGGSWMNFSYGIHKNIPSDTYNSYVPLLNYLPLKD